MSDIDRTFGPDRFIEGLIAACAVRGIKGFARDDATRRGFRAITAQLDGLVSNDDIEMKPCNAALIRLRARLQGGSNNQFEDYYEQLHRLASYGSLDVYENGFYELAYGRATYQSELANLSPERREIVTAAADAYIAATQPS